jgi:hypothetical protein
MGVWGMPAIAIFWSCSVGFGGGYSHIAIKMGRKLSNVSMVEPNGNMQTETKFCGQKPKCDFWLPVSINAEFPLYGLFAWPI